MSAAMDSAGKFKHIQIVTTISQNYLRFEIQGRYDFGEFQQMVSDMKQACVAQGVKSALIDLLSLQGDIPQFERFTLGKLWAEVWGGALKAAILAPMEKVNRFFENTAVNRQARVQVFFEEKPALEWLLKP